MHNRLADQSYRGELVEEVEAACGSTLEIVQKLGQGFAVQPSSPASTNRLGRTTASANRSHQRQLLSLLHDDRQAAERLINQVQQNHPDRSVDWCVEKVIYDLQRDRH